MIVAGTRRILQVIDRPSPGGSAGIGIDVTESEAMRAELARMTEAHRRTLDQLSTAVAIFRADQRMTFYNAAFRQLWGLEAAFLDSEPTNSAVLDRLRTARKLPEQADFRKWKAELYEAYRAIEPRQHEWYLPDGRTLRVITTPNPEGGVTYLLDDVTERIKLVRRYEALIGVQGETLEALNEGVAVFGSDGRLDLHNPAFARLWRLNSSNLNGTNPAERPHIEAVMAWCARLYADEPFWMRLRGAVTSLEAREPIHARLERTDGSVLDCTTAPLPDGATLVTFQDVTDSVNVERALIERADALQDADRLKNQFVQHVSYELRTPLTNIIGFAHLLLDPMHRADDRADHREAARLSCLDRQVFERAARDHQRHPRSHHHRCGRDAARLEGGRYPRGRRCRGAWAAGPHRRESGSARRARRPRDWQLLR